MKELTYSSTAAFLAHYHVLSKAASTSGSTYFSTQDRKTLEGLRHWIELLSPHERELLVTDNDNHERCRSSEQRRRRERALLKLHRILVANEVVSG
ncbi:MAG TPA: hypothetical protein VJ728_07540 [Candidatus Binataceae bacterium]|nr:hypothetical protein [Candidatus Binataceae bacterium]